jgi:hypothetical protein
VNPVAELEAKEERFIPVRVEMNAPATRTARGQRLLTLRPEVHSDPRGGGDSAASQASLGRQGGPCHPIGYRRGMEP